MTAVRLALRLACTCMLGLVAVPAVASADEPVRPPKTAEEGDWWFEAMKIGAAQKQVTGDGVTIALIDRALDASIPELRGADIELKAGCGGRPGRSYGGPVASHGTQQAALLMGNGQGTGPGGRGIRGVAPDASLMFYRVDYRPENDDEFDCSSEQIGRLIENAARDGADIIAVAATLDDGIVPSVERVVEQGVPVVAGSASIGASEPLYPASMPGVIAVNALDVNADAWESSDDRNPHLTVAAPGVYLDAGGVYRDGWTSQAWTIGTSPATSITAGSLALVKSKYPEATGNQLIQHLIHYTGGDRGYVWDELYGFGTVSVNDMLRTSPTQWPDENPLLGDRADQAIEKYPMWASSRIKDPPSEDEGTPADEPSAGSVTKRSGDATDGETDQASGSTDDGGVPAWAWPVGGAIVLGAGAGGVLMSRGGRRMPATENHDARGV